MNPNEETIYNNGAEVNNEENPQVTNDSKKANWKMVGLGGATGILMGAGAIYAASAFAENPNAQGGASSDNSGSSSGSAHHAGSGTDVKVADVNPGQSFSDAFAEARAEVGPGGVFHWHGGIYNTYTKEEWDSMSAEEKHDFAESIHPEYGVEKVHVDAHHAQAHVVDDPQLQNVNIEELHIHMDVDDDVHIVTQTDDYDTLIGDNVAHVTEYEVDGHQAGVIDYYDEDQHDIAVVDLNDNEALDDGEAMDLHTGEFLDANLNPMDPISLASDNIDVVDYGTDPSLGA